MDVYLKGWGAALALHFLLSPTKIFATPPLRFLSIFTLTCLHFVPVPLDSSEFTEIHRRIFSLEFYEKKKMAAVSPQTSACVAGTWIWPWMLRVECPLFRMGSRNGDSVLHKGGGQLNGRGCLENDCAVWT